MIEPLRLAGAPSRRFPAKPSVAAAIVIAAAVFSFAVPIVPSAVVREARSGRLAAAAPLSVGATMGIAYIHSANKGAVLDEFRVDADGGLVMERSTFQSFGAGMSDGDEPGVAMRLTPDGVELSGLHRKIGVVRMAVGTIAGHRLIAGGREIALASRVAAGTFITIAYQRIPLFYAVRERIRNGRDRK